MRTVILSGLVYIGDKINSASPDKITISFIAIVLVSAIIMDISEFLKKMFAKH